MASLWFGMNLAHIFLACLILFLYWLLLSVWFITRFIFYDLLGIFHDVLTGFYAFKLVRCHIQAAFSHVSGYGLNLAESCIIPNDSAKSVRNSYIFNHFLGSQSSFIFNKIMNL